MIDGVTIRNEIVLNIEDAGFFDISTDENIPASIVRTGHKRVYLAGNGGIVSAPFVCVEVEGKRFDITVKEV